MTHSQRLQVALGNIQPGQWELFERLCSAFLASEQPNLRTTARAAGDKGRDAQLWMAEGTPSVLYQFSVTKDWNDKVRETVATLRSNFPDARVVTYLSNQVIGADADDVKAKHLREDGYYLDVRDRSWFLERASHSLTVERAVEEFCSVVADPLLRAAASGERAGGTHDPLSSHERHAALLYLQMQLADSRSDRNLTKLAFEALVRAALVETDSDHRLSRVEVHARVEKLVPSQEVEAVRTYTDTALKRLTKRFIRHWEKPDEFCLMHEEALRLREGVAGLVALDDDLDVEMARVALIHAEALSGTFSEPLDQLVARIRRIVENFLCERGEAFVRSLGGGSFQDFTPDELKRFVLEDLNANAPGQLGEKGRLVAVIAASVATILTEPPASMRRYLRSLADAYTLFAFLRETPNVQSAVVKMFSHGEIWLDTNVLLPLLVEDLADEDERHYSELVRAAGDAGLKLHVTNGVLEELASNVWRAKLYDRGRYGEWLGNIPILYNAYIWSGRKAGCITEWLRIYCGDQQPERDLAAFLEEEYAITVVGLEDAANSAAPNLRAAVEVAWAEAHAGRHHGDDEDTFNKLVRHDMENYLGVIQRRTREKDSVFGFSAWWLTFDRKAHRLAAELERDGFAPLNSPTISPDFLVNCLSIGPLRRHLENGARRLPTALMDIGVLDFVPTSLLELAGEVRSTLGEMPERVIRREVRDLLNKGRVQLEELGEGGTAQVMEKLRETLAKRAEGRHHARV